MNGSDIALILTAVTGLVAAVMSGVVALMVAKTAAKLAEVKALTETIKTATDGMKSDLVAVTGRAAHAEGKAEGKAEQKAEVAADAVVEGTQVAERPVVAQPVHLKETSKPPAAKAATKKS